MAKMSTGLNKLAMEALELDLSAKFWLQPVELARNFGFSAKELRRIQRLVVQNQENFLEAWHGHLGGSGLMSASWM